MTPLGPAGSSMALPRLLLLTDRTQLRAGRGLIATIAECVEAGASHVILRELDLPTAQRISLVSALARVGATVIAAREPLRGACGVHLPPGVAPAPTKLGGGTDERRGPSAPSIVGSSCHSREEVRAAAAGGATYATLGPFALTASKPGYRPPLPRSAYANLPLPTYALGGIDPSNARQALEAGAYGTAVMGAVMRALTPRAVVRELLEAIA